MLTDLELSDSYRSDKHVVLRDFYLPCLGEATTYDRAAGYFTSGSLSAAARGLTALIGRGGRMRLVASPELSKEDVEAIREGYERRAVVERALIRGLTEEMPDAERDQLGFLAWLIGEELLDIKIALVASGANGLGLYHEKFGIFHDEAGNRVTFVGSANESIGGLRSNFEVVDVFRSWIDADVARVQAREKDFDALWDDRTKNLEIFEFPDAVRKRLLHYRPSRRPSQEPWDPGDTERWDISPHMPSSLKLRDYQEEAVRNWFRANGVGMLEMATGTGKTVTALSAMTKLNDVLQREDRALLTIVVCPFKHLVEQWAAELARFGTRPILCFESTAAWATPLQDALAGQTGSELSFVVAVTTNATFASDVFQSVIAGAPADVLLIGDEVHNLGAPHLRSALPPSVEYRLGLSATPRRHRDDVGTRAIFDYFGEPVYTIDLERAIAIGVLTPYHYIPVPVLLDDEELEEYVELTRRIGAMMGPESGELAADDLEDGPLKAYLIKRARLLGAAKGKLATLFEIMSTLKGSSHNLVYCSDAAGMNPFSGQIERQVEAVVKILGSELHMHVNSYTYETTMEERARHRQDLASGDVQALVAIRCLDEGVDIPEVRRGFILASSTNPRQFIQRRGRLLRLAEGKSKAELYDFIVTPPTEALDETTFDVERRLVRRELERVVEFAGGAMNREEALTSLLDLRERYHLLDMG